MTSAEQESAPLLWKRLFNAIQHGVFAYDFDSEELARRAREPRERIAVVIATILAVVFFIASAILVSTGQIDNKPTSASTGLVGIHNAVTLDVKGWFADDIWWYQKQTPTPLPFTAIGFLFMVVGYSPEAVLILHAALGAWCGFLLFRVCQNRFGGVTGLIACLILYTLPLFLFVTLSGWTFVWATTSLLLAITLLDRYQKSKRMGWYFLAAVAIGCAGMSRPENYMVAIIAGVFVAAPLRYRPLFVAIAFTYPILQYLHNNVYLDAPPGLRILEDARSSMTLSQIVSEWAVDVYRNIGRKSYSILFLVLGGVGVVVFGVPRRRFLTSVLLYFVVALGAAYAMRRLSFNHEGYFYAHLILLIPFIAQAIWRCGWIVGKGLQKVSLPPRFAWGAATAVMIGLFAFNMYEQRNWIRSRLFFQIRPEIKEARDYLRANAASDDSIAIDYVGETSWLLGELESDTGRDIWFYGSISANRPKVNAARPDAPQKDIDAMNDWVASGFREWSRVHRPKYLLVPSDLEWQEHATNSKAATQYKMFGLRPALDQEGFAAIPLDKDGSLLRGNPVFQNERVWIYETQTMLSAQRTLLTTSFDDWTLEDLRGWSAAPPGGFELIESDAGRGKSVLLKPMGDVATAINLKFRNAEIAPGQTIEVQVDMKASEPRVAVLVVDFAAVDGSPPVNIKPEHPGDGEWRTLTVRTQVPANATPGLCYLGIVLRPGASAPALGDNLSVRILDEAVPPGN